jgi:hypothetical protein
MRRLKEQVKSGERSASDALKELELVAMKNGDGFFIRTTPTWRWLMGRSRTEKKGG